MGAFQSTKLIELGSCAFRQPFADSHCKFVHGYQLKAKFWFAGSRLDSNNWIIDFGSLKQLKTELQETFDHTLVVSKHDPCLEQFQELEKAGAAVVKVMDGVGIEKFAEYCFDYANTYIRNKTNNRCWVQKVEVFEHEDNSAVYRATRQQ